MSKESLYKHKNNLDFDIKNEKFGLEKNYPEKVLIYAAEVEQSDMKKFLKL